MKRSTLSLLLVLAVGCAHKDAKKDPTKPLSGPTSSDAAKAYERGLEEKKSQNYMEATRWFETVRNTFPYSQYAALSELAIADMNYERDDYASAATAYQDFVKSHPSHPKADYAAFRVGLAHYEDKAGDFFLLPPSYERDNAPVKQSLEAFQRFVTLYPKSEYITRARDYINELRGRMAAHDRYVAGFYWKRKAWRGAAGRLIALADNYGDLENGKLRSDSLWRAAVAYQNAKDEKLQRETLTRLVQEALPGDEHRAYAEAMLKALPKEPDSSQPQPPKVQPVKEMPITPAETPSAPSQRPEAAPGPGQVPADAEQRPIAPPEGPEPAKPTTQPPPQPDKPTDQPPSAPLTDPHR